MSTPTITVPGQRVLQMIRPHAYELRRDDIVSVHGDWCTVLCVQVYNDEHASSTSVGIASVEDPDRVRTWQILSREFVCALRAEASECSVCGDPGFAVTSDGYALCASDDESHQSVREAFGTAVAR